MMIKTTKIENLAEDISKWTVAIKPVIQQNQTYEHWMTDKFLFFFKFHFLYG